MARRRSRRSSSSVRPGARLPARAPVGCRRKPVQRAVRIRSQEGMPVMHLTSYVPGALGSTFSRAELDRVPMFQLLARAGAHIAAGEQIVSATLAEPVVAQRLDVKVGAALIDLRSMMLDQHGRAVEYVEMLAVPETPTASASSSAPTSSFPFPSRPNPEGDRHEPGSHVQCDVEERQDDRRARRLRLHHRPADRAGGLRRRLHDRRRHRRPRWAIPTTACSPCPRWSPTPRASPTRSRSR